MKEMSELKEVFAQHDKNGDGTISGDDLGQILRAIGYHLTKVEQKEFPEKTIDFPKFLHIMAQKENESRKGTHLRQIFRILDKDENGYIGKEELRQVMAVHGEAIDDVELESMILEADLNGDGLINYEEFISFLLK